MFRQSPKSKVVCRKIESDMAITFSSDTSIFEPRERESLKTNQYLRPYAAITKPQLAGLLSALGEYVVRAEGTNPKSWAPRILHGIPPESAQSYYSMIGTVTKTILPSSVML